MVVLFCDLLFISLYDWMFFKLVLSWCFCVFGLFYGRVRLVCDRWRICLC